MGLYLFSVAEILLLLVNALQRYKKILIYTKKIKK